jgi:hypothetical protein
VRVSEGRGQQCPRLLGHIADAISGNFRQPRQPPSAPEAARRHAEQVKYLTLQRSELGLEALHNATSTAEHVPLGVAEQPQHLLGGRVGAAALLEI